MLQKQFIWRMNNTSPSLHARGDTSPGPRLAWEDHLAWQTISLKPVLWTRHSTRSSLVPLPVLKSQSYGHPMYGRWGN